MKTLKQRQPNLSRRKKVVKKAAKIVAKLYLSQMTKIRNHGGAEKYVSKDTPRLTPEIIKARTDWNPRQVKKQERKLNGWYERRGYMKFPKKRPVVFG